MSATVVDITRQTYGLVPSAVIHGINPSDQAWPHVQNCRSHSTTKGVRPRIAAYFKLSRVIDGTSIHTKQPVNTPSHCALRPPLRPSYVSPSPPHLPPVASARATSALSNRPDPNIAGVHGFGGRAEDMGRQTSRVL